MSTSCNDFSTCLLWHQQRIPPLGQDHCFHLHLQYSLLLQKLVNPASHMVNDYAMVTKMSFLRIHKLRTHYGHKTVAILFSFNINSSYKTVKCIATEVSDLEKIGHGHQNVKSKLSPYKINLQKPSSLPNS